MQYTPEKMDYRLQNVYYGGGIGAKIGGLFLKRLEDFDNEYLFVLPQRVLREYTSTPIIANLFVTDLGFFPNAEYHYVSRQNGAPGWIIIFCTGGSGTVELASRTYQLHQYSLIILPPNVQHVYYASRTDPWDIYWLHFCGDLVDEYLNMINAQRPSDAAIFIDQVPDKQVDGLMRQFWSMIKAFIPGFSANSIFFVSQVLGAMLAELAQIEHDKTTETKGSSYVDLAIQYIYNHIDQAIKLKEIADVLGISTSYLSRTFRSVVGISVNAFITGIKMKRASHDLQYTNVPIQQIASRLGYDDSYYFSRVFKKEFRVAPRRFRQKFNEPATDEDH